MMGRVSGSLSSCCFDEDSHEEHAAGEQSLFKIPYRLETIRVGDKHVLTSLSCFVLQEQRSVCFSANIRTFVRKLFWVSEAVCSAEKGFTAGSAGALVVPGVQVMAVGLKTRGRRIPFCCYSPPGSSFWMKRGIIGVNCGENDCLKWSALTCFSTSIPHDPRGLLGSRLPADPSSSRRERLPLAFSWKTVQEC